MLEGSHEWERTGSWTILHTGNGGAVGTDLGEVKDHGCVLILTSPSQGLQILERFSPSLTRVTNYMPQGTPVFPLGGIHRLGGAVDEVRVLVGKNTPDVGHVIPVNRHHVIVVATAHPGPVKEQTQLDVREGSRGAVCKTFLGLPRLILVSVLEVSSRHEDVPRRYVVSEICKLVGAFLLDKVCVALSHAVSNVIPFLFPPLDGAGEHRTAHAFVNVTNTQINISKKF